MRRILFILAGLVVGLALVGSALAAPKILSHDGSLVIQGSDAKQAKKKAGSEDTLYDLLGQEVQVYIFNNRTRVWPRVYTHSSAPAAWQGRLTPRDPRVEALIGKYSQMYGVDPTLVRAVMRHESGFNPSAVSPKGAQGLMQLMPGTAALMGVRDPLDPEQNIAGGVGYLRQCLDRFQHNVPLAVAAYNAGPESVARCGAIPPYQETQVFVNNVMGSYTGQSGLPAAKAGAPAPGKDAQPAKKMAKPAASPTDQAPEVRRRPRPKIIEVRSRKLKPQDIAAEAE